MAEISVTDEGEPIPWLDRGLLFRTFQQLDSPQSYRAGTGLGLAICKEIIELHGGRVYYTPATPKGNRFAFTLPLAGKATTEAA
jgi:signal transduction histidine kinase